ncbi:piggyBac transposable element-derived protein 3-like [Penaeus monodon]|uniref:piggyBac transposable element-derived protein 3-like n=1 Tax=Penaeus monodon TaxID=6687 RepID=UPI0018A788B2|nr:piggyBac transposable element-derived protein 3-like [Penaeus monodon]
MMVDHLRAEFKQIPMTEHLSIDEQMVPFKGASGLKQYIPKKTVKWGYKLFVLADHKGMIYDFFPYEGKKHPVRREGVPDLGASANSVLILAESIPENKNHKLYIDNWFTSKPLVEHLATRGIWICGTIQARRSWFIIQG